VIERETEPGVFTLVGVRQQLGGRPFPRQTPLNLFLVLFSPRNGIYRGNVVIVQVKTDRTIRYSKFQAEFDADYQALPLNVDLGLCEFPEPGLYAVQVWFSPAEGQDVLKAELPFDLLEHEE
jgi:hypothetical protein